jgi:predicted O-methyltransferase YrrM
LFEQLAEGALKTEELRGRLGLAERPMVVLTTALKALGLLVEHGEQLEMSPLAREHLVPGAPGYVGDYLGLAANAPGVVEMATRLKSNRPANAEAEQGGAAFFFRDGIESAMEAEASARHFTLALAGRAKNVAPVLAERMPVGEAQTILDVAGGTGIYSIALLQKHPRLRAIVFDRPEVLKIAGEFAATYGVAERVECRAGDMFADVLPTADIVLLSNVLHDWDAPECRQLVSRCAAALPAGGELWIHDVFLNDALDGPLPIALYSAALFTLTEGRAYSAAEFRAWMADAGLATGEIVPTLVHCGVLVGKKRG